MKQEFKKEVIVIPINDPKKALNDYSSLFFLNQNELENIANDETQPIVKRKMIEFLVSEDPKISMDAIKWLQNIISGNNLITDIDINSTNFFLSESQQQIYDDIKGSLANKNLLKKGDDHLLKLYSINLDRYNKMSIFVEMFGMKAKFGSGHEQIRPEVNIMNNCMTQIIKLSNILGLNTLSTHKNGIKETIELNTDPLNDLI